MNILSVWTRDIKARYVIVVIVVVVVVVVVVTL